MRRSSCNLLAIIILSVLTGSCSKQKLKLSPVTYEQFEAFVDATAYVTDAERYGWSIVQVDVYDFKKVDGATWRMPDGFSQPISKQLPVTQVSFNDAIAYCEWAGKRLPTYEEYWKLIASDVRPIVSDNLLPISEVDQVNTLGNVWEITSSTIGEGVRLAGGSVFCSPNTCYGTVSDRALYVDKETGNIHIGFAVLD